MKVSALIRELQAWTEKGDLDIFCCNRNTGQEIEPQIVHASESDASNPRLLIGHIIDLQVKP